MARIKYEFELKKVARIIPAMGAPIIVGEVEEYFEDNGKVRVIVKLDPNLPKGLLDAIILKPGVLSITQITQNAKDVIVLPEVAL